MVRQQTPLVPSHAQVVDEQRARCGRVLRRVERILRECLAILVRHAAAERRKDVRHIPVEITHFANARTHQFRLVRWECREG